MKPTPAAKPQRSSLKLRTSHSPNVLLECQKCFDLVAARGFRAHLRLAHGRDLDEEAFGKLLHAELRKAELKLAKFSKLQQVSYRDLSKSCDATDIAKFVNFLTARGVRITGGPDKCQSEATRDQEEAPMLEDAEPGLAAGLSTNHAPQRSNPSRKCRPGGKLMVPSINLEPLLSRPRERHGVTDLTESSFTDPQLPRTNANGSATIVRHARGGRASWDFGVEEDRQSLASSEAACSSLSSFSSLSSLASKRSSGRKRKQQACQQAVDDQATISAAAAGDASTLTSSKVAAPSFPVTTSTSITQPINAATASLLAAHGDAPIVRLDRLPSTTRGCYEAPTYPDLSAQNVSSGDRRSLVSETASASSLSSTANYGVVTKRQRKRIRRMVQQARNRLAISTAAAATSVKDELGGAPKLPYKYRNDIFNAAKMLACPEAAVIVESELRRWQLERNPDPRILFYLAKSKTGGCKFMSADADVHFAYYLRDEIKTFYKDVLSGKRQKSILDEKVEIHRISEANDSGIAGLRGQFGVFAKQDLPANSLLGCYPGAIIREGTERHPSSDVLAEVLFNQQMKDPNILEAHLPRYSYSYEISDDDSPSAASDETRLSISGLNRSNGLVVLNSLTPEDRKKELFNAAALTVRMGGQIPLIVIYTTKPVAAERQLFLDYGAPYWKFREEGTTARNPIYVSKRSTVDEHQLKYIHRFVKDASDSRAPWRLFVPSSHVLSQAAKTLLAQSRSLRKSDIVKVKAKDAGERSYIEIADAAKFKEATKGSIILPLTKAREAGVRARRDKSKFVAEPQPTGFIRFDDSADQQCQTAASVNVFEPPRASVRLALTHNYSNETTSANASSTSASSAGHQLLTVELHHEHAQQTFFGRAATGANSKARKPLPRPNDIKQRPPLPNSGHGNASRAIGGHDIHDAGSRASRCGSSGPSSSGRSGDSPPGREALLRGNCASESGDSLSSRSGVVSACSSVRDKLSKRPADAGCASVKRKKATTTKP